MTNVDLSNPYLSELSEDCLYHFGLTLGKDDVSVFKDVKFVCAGGSSQRIRVYSELFAARFHMKPSPNLSRSDRYCLFLTGPVLWLNHGIGVPSLSIVLNETFKLLARAGARAPAFVRVGTSGGVGVPAGTVVVSGAVLDRRLRAQLVTYAGLERRVLPCAPDPRLSAGLLAAGRALGFAVVHGNTYCADDFYEGQMRLDGAFCSYTKQQKQDFLNTLAEHGVKNIEMESVGFVGLTTRAGCKSAVVCVALLDRTQGDQVTLSPELYNEFELRPFNIVARYIAEQLGLQANGC